MIVGEITIKGSLLKAATVLPDLVAARMDALSESLKSNIQRDLQVSNNNGLSPSTPGDTPRRGSGELSRAIQWRRHNQFDRDIGVFASSSVPFARRMEFGGWATSQSPSGMTVPISDEAIRHHSRNRGLGTFPKRDRLFRLTSQTGKVLLVEKKGRGKNAKLVVHYWLADAVYMAPRPFLRPAVHDTKFLDQVRMAFRDIGGDMVVAATRGS